MHSFIMVRVYQVQKLFQAWQPLFSLQPSEALKETFHQVYIHSPPSRPPALLPVSLNAQKSCLTPALQDLCLLGAFQKRHRPSTSGTLKPEGSLRSCLMSSHLPGEESISVIQKGHKKSRFLRSNLDRRCLQSSGMAGSGRASLP